jgi:hypothetical protein
MAMHVFQWRLLRLCVVVEVSPLHRKSKGIIIKLRGWRGGAAGAL